MSVSVRGFCESGLRPLSFQCATVMCSHHVFDLAAIPGGVSAVTESCCLFCLLSFRCSLLIVLCCARLIGHWDCDYILLLTVVMVSLAK
jgi:hypothetical protein